MSQNNGSDRWMFVSLLSQFHLSQIVCALPPPDNLNMPTTQWCCARKSLILNGFISTAICANIVIEFVTGKLFKLPENGIYIRGGFIKKNSIFFSVHWKLSLSCNAVIVIWCEDSALLRTKLVLIYVNRLELWEKCTENCLMFGMEVESRSGNLICFIFRDRIVIMVYYQIQKGSWCYTYFLIFVNDFSFIFHLVFVQYAIHKM